MMTQSYRRRWALGRAVCVTMLLASAAGGGGLVVTAKDLPMAVGRRMTYSLATPAGQQFAEMRMAVIGRRTVGENTLYREAARFGAIRIPDFWVAVADDGLAVYDSFGAARPVDRHPLPLKKGMTFDYESTRGQVEARVEGPEEVEVPAGKFTCLVIVREREADGRQQTEKEWLAPGAGTVKAAGEGFVMMLTRAEAPAKAQPEADAVPLSTFDTPDPLRSTLFPRAQWNGAAGQPDRSSVVAIDPFTGGADGTPFCLRWTYAAVGTWASASLTPGGDPWTPVDLSKYAGVSFYIKGLFERGCSVSIQARAADGEEKTFVHIPIQVTKQWRKVVLTPQTHPQFNHIDASQVYIVGVGDADEEGAANVIWLDEVKLLLRTERGEF
ncbi:MAG: hypothetical protein ACODAJ_01265 [Planctomycetota bacterium]